MIHSEISHHRMTAQKLFKTTQCSPQEVVKHFGAMQAQDYAMAKWAVGSRCDASEKEIEEVEAEFDSRIRKDDRSKLISKSLNDKLRAKYKVELNKKA